jgi:hypothetical protein
MDFFDDINIPKANVQPDTLFDKEEQVGSSLFSCTSLYYDTLLNKEEQGFR